MKEKLLGLFLTLLLCVSPTLFAQTISVQGVVTDEAGEPLIGASVVVKDT